MPFGSEKYVSRYYIILTHAIIVFNSNGNPNCAQGKAWNGISWLVKMFIVLQLYEKVENIFHDENRYTPKCDMDLGSISTVQPRQLGL